jgi:hypothetical protein
MAWSWRQEVLTIHKRNQKNNSIYTSNTKNKILAGNLNQREQDRMKKLQAIVERN